MLIKKDIEVKYSRSAVYVSFADGSNFKRMYNLLLPLSFEVDYFSVFKVVSLHLISIRFSDSARALKFMDVLEMLTY